MLFAGKSGLRVERVEPNGFRVGKWDKPVHEPRTSNLTRPPCRNARLRSQPKKAWLSWFGVLDE
jgi:hypothetical protein